MTNGPVGNTFGGEEVVPDCSGGAEEDWFTDAAVVVVELTDRSELFSFQSYSIYDIIGLLLDMKAPRYTICRCPFQSIQTNA